MPAGRAGVRRPRASCTSTRRSTAPMSFPAARTWACSRPWATRRTWGEFYRLEEYEGYCWTAHGRYPTNTPGWWGGAHPFALLDYSVVHNGEISSYDANRRFIEMFGYKCTLHDRYRGHHLHHGLPAAPPGADAARRLPPSSPRPSGAPSTSMPAEERERLHLSAQRLLQPADHRALFHPAGL